MVQRNFYLEVFMIGFDKLPRTGGHFIWSLVVTVFVADKGKTEFHLTTRLITDNVGEL